MGTALAAVLFGDRDPAGRLPVTLPADDLTVWSAGTWTLVPGLHTFATARDSRTVTAQRALAIS